MKYIITLLLILQVSNLSFSQDKRIKEFSSSITEAELLEHVQILASDEYQGRETGSEGQKKAALYIKENFQTMKLFGPSSGTDPYYQEFALVKNSWEKLSLVKELDTLELGQEIHATGSWPEGAQVHEMVFVGYGTDTEHYSDYSGINVEGKIVAFLNGEPMNKLGKFLTTDSYVPEYSIVGYDKARLAIEKGAMGAIMIDPDQSKIDNLIKLQKRFNKSQQFFLPGTGTSDNSPNGLIAVGYNNASLLFANNISDWAKYQKKMNKGKTVSGKLTSKIELISEKGSNKIIGENVLGMIKGSDFPDEYVIVTAHYDHLGQSEDRIFNGADDNASGTAAVIEIAEAFAEAAAAGFPPKRSIIFMPVAGEEKGLLGSKHYASNPVVPLENTKAAINMDMIGRQDSYSAKDTSYVFLYLSDIEGSVLDQTAKTASRLEGEDMITVYKYSNNSDYRMGGSDHASFEDEDVPVLYFYCGTHKDYHRPSDTWEKLDYKNMTRITRMVFVSAWELANQD